MSTDNDSIATAAGSLDTAQLLVMAAKAQRNAVGDASLIAARIDQMVVDLQSAQEEVHTNG